MIYRLICALLVIALALPASALGEGMIEWDRATVGAEAKASPEPTETGASFDGMATLPPADALKSEGPLVPVDLPEAEVEDAQAFADVPATAVPEVTLAPIPQADIGDDGLLRVELRSLGKPGQLHLTLLGSYAVEADPGFRFDSGTAVTLSAVQDRVWLFVGGLSIDMGKTLTLTRHRVSEGVENGIRIVESENDALYCGDLSVTARGSALRCVLTLPVEDYLYGVVAYEMSSSFPLEALKAQSVAARTFAMKRKAGAGARDYDVVDTTADQVFKGYDPGYANVIRAVDDTRGVVGLYDGGFATCYYTASNGGQTALPSQIWGGDSDDGYLSMADDPYDLENPRSLQNELTVSTTCEGSPALRAMLEAALGEVMASAGVGEGRWSFDSIAAIRLVNPRFEGSRMVEGLEFDLRAKLLQPEATAESAPTPEATPLPDGIQPSPDTDSTDSESVHEPTEPPMEWVLSDDIYRVTLDVYGQIKDGLSLGLNAADYELMDVETVSDDAGAPQAFKLIMRRFGHGVGMSQRGAQWMAGNYGLTWREILDFYYPGVSLVRMNWPEPVMTALDALPDSVGAARPDPTLKPLPEPQSGEHYATVTATALNVRQQPSTDAPVLEQLEKGRRVVAASEADADGWVKVHTGEVDGFVKAEYLGE
jgi:peptidoglycan hydrolase-like amidase